MPYRALVFIYRKPHMTPAEFKSHYETYHVPLVKSLAGDLAPKSYTRRYVQRSSDGVGNHPAAVIEGTQEDFDYDAVVGLDFENEAAFKAFYERIYTGEAGEKLRGDEREFQVREKVRAVILEDCCDD